MMHIRFQPLPGLTAVTLICLTILISLGVWQYKRLQWKTTLIAEIDQAANSAPLTSLREVERLIDNETPHEFRRIGFLGEYLTPAVNHGLAYHLMMSDGKSMFWRPFQPVANDGVAVFVAGRKFPDTEKPFRKDLQSGNVQIAGYVRKVRPPSKFMPVSDPVDNKWFAFNALPKYHNWADTVERYTINTDYYIDLEPGFESASRLSVKKPKLRNNHLGYMLTWYVLALILFVIYLILHHKCGRLRFKGKV